LRKLAVTTSYHPEGVQLDKALSLALSLKIPFCHRGESSLDTFFQDYEALVIVQAKKIVLKTPEEEFFFHPNMAKLRINNIKQGRPDHLIQSLDLQKGDKLLDCTLGLGSDAITASYWIGEEGQVIALEDVSLIYEITTFGLTHFQINDSELQKAMQRIKTINANYLDYLKKTPDKSFDIVYFDPMFDRTILGSTSMLPLRVFARKELLSYESLEEAKRVARKRVVMKARRGSKELKRLGFPYISGGTYSNIQYGYFLLC